MTGSAGRVADMAAIVCVGGLKIQRFATGLLARNVATTTAALGSYTLQRHY
jgi:hypothetical protein